ncbi:hypothetical protein BKA64DRAFT_663857 [Cadophora sp. MPI-SDFR-AT-0126]|nr:hypothetical protein BKA64DRAFT_663857 [Leotiomycetes sp. MPI-SDFR-AT-0126]
MANSTFILPNGPSPLMKFHCFNDLPLEMRQYIWYLCLPGPRIHRIGWTDPKKSSRSSCVSPTIMFVSQESRREALHHLKELSLPSVVRSFIQATPSGCTSRCYFNPKLDTLFIPTPSHPAMSLSPWLISWLKGLDNTDFSIVQNLAIDRAWVEHVTPVLGSVVQLGEVVRLLGHVKVVHVVSLNSHWNMQPWTMWREIGRMPEDMRAEFFWVDIEEVKKRPIDGYSRIWAEWGENSQMLRAGSDFLSLGGESAIARLEDVVQRLEAEKEKYPTGWSMPRVQLDFVRYDRVKREEKPSTLTKKRVAGLSSLGTMLSDLPSVTSFKKWVGRG